MSPSRVAFFYSTASLATQSSLPPWCITSSQLLPAAFDLFAARFFSPQELKVLEGQSVTLRCKARGDPDPIIHWIAPDGRLMSNSSRAAVHTDGTLDILISTVKDSGPLTPHQLHFFIPPPVRQNLVVSSCTLRMSGRLSTMHDIFLSIESPMRRLFHTSFILF